MACPNDCSGHGLCRLLAEIDTAVPYPAAAWDSDHIQACVCDAGFFGNDCSQRSCPTGDDPLTLCSTDVKGMVQEVKVELGSVLNHPVPLLPGASVLQTNEGMDLFGVTGSADFNTVVELPQYAQLRVGATDSSGQVFYSPTSARSVFSMDPAAQALIDPSAVTTSDLGSMSLEVALETIADQTVYQVEVHSKLVDPVGTGNVLAKRYVVEYVPNELSSSNFGVQGLLVCDSGYGCANSGCSPQVAMPFLVRYAAKNGERSDFDSSSGFSAAGVTYFTGQFNSDASFVGSPSSVIPVPPGFMRLDASSSPRLPLGSTVDQGLTASSNNRYDIRVVVAVQDPNDPTTSDSATDVYWTKVIYGNTAITTDTYEYDLDACSTNGVLSACAGPWSASSPASNYIVGTLLGFTYRGFIPSGLVAAIPDAPGVVLNFPSTNMVYNDLQMRFFEILIKLPSCTVTPLLTGAEFLDALGMPIAPVDKDVENIECSNRGQCNRDSGLCECFTGFYGAACSKQTTMV